MRLKSLELFGFKSFADKTALQFEPGTTCVVGPNGCGKSNIVDAIRWVMGEMSAKHLRGSAMQDVIFNGTDKRPSLNMAQVTLTFDLTDGRAPAGFSDYPEIQVERRLYRTGESEYYINKVACRLKDIVDLFLGTGIGTKAYSIVEQGRITQILNSKPEERRLIIEEAAGISKFKHRKETALRKMEMTQINVNRLNDIIAELKRQLNSLDRQARKAERYKKLYDELRERDLTLTGFRYNKIRQELDVIEVELQKLTEEEASLGANLSRADVNMERERMELSGQEEALNQLQEKLYMSKNAAKLHETAIGYQENQTKEIQTKEKTYLVEMEQFKKKLADLQEDLDSLNQKKVKADLAQAESSEQVEARETGFATERGQEEELKRKVDLVQNKILQCVRSISEAQSKLEQMERQGIDLAGNLSKSATEIDAIDKRREDLRRRITTTEKGLTDLKQLRLNLVSETGTLQGDLEIKKKTLATAEQELETFRGELSFQESQIRSLEELKQNLEGYHDGVKEVLRSKTGETPTLKGIVGTIGEMIDTDPKFEPAVGAALGEKLQYVVVASHQEGVEAIGHLKQVAKGRSTFVSMDLQAGVDQETEAVSGPGVIGPLLEHVRFADDYRQIAKYLFGDVVLVEDLQNALDLWRGKRSGQHAKQTFVTVDGEVVDSYGVVSGGLGGGAAQTLLGQKRRLEELEKELALLKARGVEAQEKALRAKTEVRSFEEQWEALKKDSHEEELRLVNQERDLGALKTELARYDQERDRLSVQIAVLKEEENEIHKEQEQAVGLLEEQTQIQIQLQNEKEGLEQNVIQCRKTVDTAQQKLTSLKVQLAQEEERAATVEREINHLIRTKVEVQSGIDFRIQEINQGQQNLVRLAESLKEEKVSLSQALQDVEKLTTVQRTQHEEYRTRTDALQNQSGELREIRKRHETLVREVHEHSIKQTESRAEVRQLSEQMLERYKVDLSFVATASAPMPADWEETKEGEIVADLRDRLDKLGSVSVDAITEYDELKNRYEFLSKQKEDLENSMEDLRRAIQKINRTSRERFAKAFEMVNERFQEIFPRLFNGGRAKLLLIDEENLLESGVEIFAQPPGKKLQSITLLSGGEKALTAVALIFSIFLIKPSPFCLLDEVDAPLDDANIDRFNEMVQAMTPHSQFILITHNKRTMEQGDVLYGVTMQEPGVSQLVSVRLKQGESLPDAAVA